MPINQNLFVVFPDGSKLPVHGNVVLGRTDFKGFVSDDELNLISTKQCSIYKEGNIYFVEDGAKGKYSSNGTMLNGQDVRALGKQPLRSGDAISIADVIIINIDIR